MSLSLSLSLSLSRFLSCAPETDKVLRYLRSISNLIYVSICRSLYMSLIYTYRFLPIRSSTSLSSFSHICIGSRHIEMPGRLHLRRHYHDMEMQVDRS